MDSKFFKKDSNLSQDWLGSLYNINKLHNLLSMINSEFILPCKIWIFKILDGSKFLKQIQTPTSLVGWSLLTELYPDILKL